MDPQELAIDDAKPLPETPPWTVLVVDDDPGVLAISRMALRRVRVEGRDLTLVTAQSGAEAVRWLEGHAEPDVLLVDMQLETADAGMALLRELRNRLGCRWARVLLRSGGDMSRLQADLVDLDVSAVIGKAEIGLAELRAAVAQVLGELNGRSA